MMGTTFILMTTLKLAAMGGLGITLATGIQYFHEFKLSKKSKGVDENEIGESLLKKSRSLD